MRSPKSRQDYDLYESPPKVGGGGGGGGGGGVESQTRGLVTDAELRRNGQDEENGHYGTPKPLGGRQRRNRKVAVCTFVALGTVLAAVLHGRGGGGGGGSGGSIGYGPNNDASKNVGPYMRYSGVGSIDDADDGDAWPRVAWLMSFPNSGTSYTLRLAQWASNQTAATNYGDECELDGNGENVPLFPDMPNSPALKFVDKYSMPKRFALTKTHCGGRCTHCTPDKYVETQLTFHTQCLQGNRMVSKKKKKGDDKNDDGKKKEKSERVLEVRYDENLVKRAVHVIRDPFDNVVARFHLDYGKYQHKKDEEFLATYTYDPDGFRKWCKSIDDEYIKSEEKSRFITDDVLELFKKIPCHGDFFRYVQWHNHAASTTNKLDLPTYILHYENYATNFERTKDELMGFLQLDTVGEVPQFIPGKSYRQYYTKKERGAALELMRKIATPETWKLLSRYDYVGEFSV